MYAPILIIAATGNVYGGEIVVEPDNFAATTAGNARMSRIASLY